MHASPKGFGARALVKFALLSSVACGAIQLITLSSAWAQVSQSSPQIFDVRKSLPLEPTEPSFHDFYINAGPDAGFKKGMYLLVVRQVPVHDPVLNKQQGTLNINVARLQIIQVERSLTVARLVSEYGDEERPTLEYEAVMIGDRIDTSASTMDAPPSKKKKSFGKQAEAAPVAPAPVAGLSPKTAEAPASEPAATERSVQPVGAPPAAAPALGPSKSTSAPSEAPVSGQTIASQSMKPLPVTSDADMVRVLDLTDWPPSN